MEREDFEYKQCIVLRNDLGMSIGKLISQACHAAVESSEQAKKLKTRTWSSWRREGARKIVLEVCSLPGLEELAERSDKLDIINVLIRDRGLTEVSPGTSTALGIGPDRSELIDRVTRSLKLLK